MNNTSRPEIQPRVFLYPRDVAAYFGVSLSTVRRWAERGMLQATLTPGGHNRFPAAEFYRHHLPQECTVVPDTNPTFPDTVGPSLPPSLNGNTPIPAMAAAQPGSTPVTISSASKVMIVEDNADMRSILVSILQTNHFQVTACANGQAALNTLTTNPHANILSDIDMPVLNGQDFLCAAKNRFRESKIMMMSAGHCHRQAEFQGYGALGILSKSMGLIEMYRRVQDLTKERRTSCRLPVRMPLLVNHRDQGVLLDISADGALFETDHRHHRRLVELRLLDHRGAAVLTTTGTALRSVPREGKHLTAVYFNSSIGSQLGTLVRDGVVRPDLN
jgi:excisionase family DNA binding protein